MSPATTATSPPARLTRGFQVALAVAVLGWLGLVCSALCTVPGVPWNAARLSPSFALAEGLPIYALRDSGAHLGWFYGPVFPLWYLPVTLTENPTLAHLLAGVINLGTMLAPFALVLRAAGVVRGRWLVAATLIAGLLLASNGTTFGGYLFVHVDIVCLALSALACVALHRVAEGGNMRWLHLAVLAAVLAFWTKAVALPLFPALGIWLWREGHRQLLRPLLFWSAVYGGLVSLVIFWSFGPQEVLFNVWLVFARNPWAGGWMLLLENVRDAMGQMAVWLALLLWAWRDARSAPRVPLSGRAAALARLLLWVAACQLPLGLAATVKVGASLNSLHSLTYLLMAAMILFCHRWAQPVATRRAGWVTPTTAFALAMVAAVGMTAWNLFNFQSVWTLYRGQEELLATARKHQGAIYFPWNPLVTLIVERKIYPLDDALLTLWRSGLEPPREKIWAAVPARAVVFYQEPAQSHFALNYFGPGKRPKPEAAP